MRVVQIRLPKKIVEKIDEIIEKEFYSSRSEFIRVKLREILEKDY
ncbi:MAG: CopG family transcriptional regulator [Candidatus Aenigmatarchaeota archaeon]|nr:MAG: CopG family transcriptional regulator [Candidatus Aenigmarchaeota archaeon]